MVMLTRPMLAGRLKDLADLRFPAFLTPKLDGIRCLKVDGKALTRTFKPVQNAYIRQLIETLPDGLDGELMTPGDFSSVQSDVMRREGRPDFEYWVFDLYSDEHTYMERIGRLKQLQLPDFVKVLAPIRVESLDGFLALEDEWLSKGFEGVIARSADGPYKCGRSSLREGYMVKYKRYQDSEAIIIGFEEAMENCNPQEANAFGHMKRPGGKEEHYPKGTLGAFAVKDVVSGVIFSVGTGIGLTASLRQRIWNDRPSYLGRIVRYTYQGCGTKDRPRFPSFQGFREAEDL